MNILTNKITNKMNDNKLIAEFMGAVLGKKIVAFPDIKLEDNLGIISNNRSFEDLHYHSSWDWLMPVVIKCFEVDEQTNDNLNFKLNDALLETNIDSLYQAVVEFINQYNNK
jgi:hypothetical protein